MNRIAMIIELLHAGVELKDARGLVDAQLKDRAGFFAKLKSAQAGMETIIKDETNNFTKGAFAAVDQFVAKGRAALNECGLTLYAVDSKEISKGVPDNNGIEKPEKHWEMAFTLGDSGTGYRESVLFCIPVGREQEVGAADSYALKYMVRSFLMAERATDDPDRKRDIDAQQFRSKQRGEAKKRTRAAPRPKSTMKARRPEPEPEPRSQPKPAPSGDAAPKNGKRNKLTKKQMDARIKRAKDRLGVCKQELKEGPMRSILNDAGFVAGGFKTVDDFEAAAELLEARITFDHLTIRMTDRLGQTVVDEILLDFENLNNVEVLKAGIIALVDSLNSQEEARTNA